MDLAYPLSKMDLHSRYDPLFDALKRGQSSTLVGLPQSSRSAFLRFILEYDANFLSEFIDSKFNHFIILDNVSDNSSQVIHALAIKLISLNLFTKQQQELLESRLHINDQFLTLVTIKDVLKTIPRQHKIVIVLYEAEQLLSTNPELIQLLNQLWTVNRQPPNSLIHYWFIASPIFLEQTQSSFYSPLMIAIFENIFQFPLLNDQELEYTQKRLEFFGNRNIDKTVHQIASQLSGGHFVLYKHLINLSIDDLKIISETHRHPSINHLLEVIWQGISSLDKQNQNYQIPLLPPPSLVTAVVIPSDLTAQQRILFDYFYEHPNQVISRDEVAQVLWGKSWEKEYSDWAIDRAISNLRHKLAETKFKLIAIRNRGYKFF
jgi:hypothetical protein